MDLIDPDTWETYSNPNDPDTPSFRFSRYFTETCDRVTTKTAGEWLKSLDRDTINDFVETFRDIDISGKDDKISFDDDTRKDMTDLLYLTLLIWQWETWKKWDVSLNDPDLHDLQVEYMFRFATLVQYEYLQRIGGKSKEELLERDHEQYQGKLSIFEE